MLLRIATRGSALATAQSRLVVEKIVELDPSIQAEFITFTTRGDKTGGALWQAGGKGLFTAELEDALISGDADIAVHSAKDMPARLNDNLPIIAVLPREDPRDALICAKRIDTPQNLPANSYIGTSSLRRAAFAKKLLPTCRCKPMRGNVDTRIKKIVAGEFDAGILAMAGLKRLDMLASPGVCIVPLNVETFIPAPGQGCIAVQCSAKNHGLMKFLAGMDDERSRLALDAERGVLMHFGVGCHSCFAVHFSCENATWRGFAMAAKPDGEDMLLADAAGAEPEAVKSAVIELLTAKGIENLLENE